MLIVSLANMELERYLWIIALVLIALTCWLVVKHSQSYWKRFNVQTPSYHFLLGHSLPQMLGRQASWKMFGDFYTQFKASTKMLGIYLLTRPALLILDLDLAKRVLITDFEVFDSRGVYMNEKDDPISAHLFSMAGDKWRRLRNKLSPTFTSGKLKHMFPIMVDISKNFNKCVADIAKENPSGFMIKNVTSRFTTDVIGSCAFGLDCNSLLDPDNRFRRMGDMFFKRTFKRSMAALFKNNFPDLSNWLGFKVVPEAISSFFSKTVEETVNYRESSASARNDFMDLLVKIKHSEKKEDRLTLDEIASQSFIFFIAGFETSSSTMMFCLFELAKRPDLQSKAREHIQSVLKKHDGHLTYEALMEMDYLDKVVNETLRKYPPVPTLTRRANRNYKIPDTEVVVKKGTMVLIPALSIQMDPEIYENPEEFNPHRFDKDAIGQRHPCSFIAFGEGPRICIGARFGMVQAKIGILSLLTSFKFSLSEKTEVPIKMHKFAVLLMPEDDIHLKVERIESDL